MMSDKNHLGPVLPRSLVDYHRITKDMESTPVHASHTRAGKLFAKVKLLVKGVFGLLHSVFSKKAEPTSILVGDEITNSLLDRVQLPLSVQNIEADEKLDYSKLPKLQKALNLVRADKKIISEARKQLPIDSKKLIDLSMEYGARIESLDTLEIMLTDAIFILEEKYKHTYVTDLQKVKELQFEGYAPGFIKVKQEAVDIFLEIVTGEKRADSEFSYTEFAEEIIPLLINIDTLARVVAIWNEYPGFEEASGFSKSQIALIRGMVESFFGKKTPIYNLEVALSKAPLLFISEEVILEIVSKITTGGQSSLSEAERRIYQLIILQLPMLESSGKYAAIVQDIKSALKYLNSFSDFRSYFEREFFPLSTLNQQYSNNLLFEIFYVVQDKFSSLPIEERTKKTILERASAFIQTPTQEIESEKPATSIEVDGEMVAIPDEIDGWLDKGYTIKINGETYSKGSSALVSIYKALKKAATRNGIADENLLRSLLTVTGFGSEPKIRTEIMKAVSLLGNDYQVYTKELTLPEDLYINISVQPDGSIKIESAFAYLLVDKSSGEDRILPQKLSGKQEFILVLEDDVYTKTQVHESLVIDDMSQDAADDDYASQLQVADTNIRSQKIADLPSTVRDKIAIQNLILDEMIADLSYRSSFDSDELIREKQIRYAHRLADMQKSPIFSYIKRVQFEQLVTLFSREAMSIAFSSLEKKYKPNGKLFLDEFMKVFREERKEFNVDGFEKDITVAINAKSSTERFLREKMVKDLHRRLDDEDIYIRKDGSVFTLKERTEKKEEEEYFNSLVEAMGGDSVWIKPISAFYSQLIPNQRAGELISSANYFATQGENPQVIFGTTCYFLTDHIRSKITVREVDDTHKEFICRDYFRMRLSPSSHGSGIEIIPEGDFYFESRFTLEKKDFEDESSIIEAKNFSVSYSTDGITQQAL